MSCKAQPDQTVSYRVYREGKDFAEGINEVKTSWVRNSNP